MNNERQPLLSIDGMRKRKSCRKWSCLGVILLGITLIVMGSVLILHGRQKRQKPDLSSSCLYLNTKDSQIVRINDVSVFGEKDFSGNVQLVHAVQTTSTIYTIENERIVRIQSNNDSVTMVFDYKITLQQYNVMLIWANSSYLIPHVYSMPTVTFPQPQFEFPADISELPDPFTGILIQLQDEVYNRSISDASMQLNYYDEQESRRTVVLVNVGDGKYYASLPTNDTRTDKYFKRSNMYKTVSQQSNALINLLRDYPMANICTNIPEALEAFCTFVTEEMSVTIPDTLTTVSKYVPDVPQQSELPGIMINLEIVMSIPGERTVITPLDRVNVYPDVLSTYLMRYRPLLGNCNDHSEVGYNTPVDREIRVGKSHVAIKFHYDTLIIRDQIDVYYSGEQVFTTGCVGTNGTRTSVLRLDRDDTNLRIKVTPNCAGDNETQWKYNVECPRNKLICEDGLCYCGVPGRRSQQVKDPSVDGCGTNHSLWYWLIHGEGEIFEFTSHCDAHDRCYGTCNNDKAKCDDIFYQAMNTQCLSSPSVELCQRIANIFYSAVKLGGGSAFRNAQNEDCWCDDSDMGTDRYAR